MITAARISSTLPQSAIAASWALSPLKCLILTLIAVLAIAAPNGVLAQAAPASSNAGWTTLARVTFTKEFDELLGLKVDKPVFGQGVIDADGKQITLKGYVIPTEGYKSHTEFVFSAYPYSMCFFCGGAGPETVVEVFAEDPIDYSPDAIVLTGTLRLNADDPNALMYRVEDARMVEQ